ncbi:hypothetical protein [Sphaerospermopsis sp. FACHB-1094]|uniref:hypothetical protein n=1 Tax=Sphaerospermopsis sp. FACHB-1094 TaxID=2692861 RepID=UPI001684A3C4|nr:hypothetical protein [Sphaerospermopsis sp. FACHB-1094]
MKDNIFDFLKGYSAEDISERVSLYKLFGGFLFAFALFYAAFWFVPHSDTVNDIFGMKISNAFGSLVLATVTCIILILFVGKKNQSNP